MAYGRVELANAALGLLGRDVIRDLDGKEPGAVQAKAHIDAAIEEVIAEHDWWQCRVVKTLTPASGINLRGYLYTYAIPSDMVKLWMVGDITETDPRLYQAYELGLNDDLEDTTNYIWANQANLSIRYGSRRAPLARFSPDVRRLMALKLASKILMPISKDKALIKPYNDMYRMELSAARTAAANTEPEFVDIEEIPELISERFA